jgi:hypothetical protein
MSGSVPSLAREAHSAVRVLEMSERLWREVIRARLATLVLPITLFCAAWLVAWQYNPLHRSLSEDPGIFAYISQLVADGLAPHKFAFNEQASLAYLVGGAAMRLGDIAGLHHLIAFRLAAILGFAIVIVLTYFLGLRLTRSPWVGMGAAAILMGFEGYGARAATALEPKSLMLVFGLASLLLLQKRQWVWAGALGCLAGLVWQIAWGYLLVALLLALVQGGKTFAARARAFGLTLAAALGVLALYTLYFVAHNAQTEMFQQTFLAPVLMHSVGGRTLSARLNQMSTTFVAGYSSHIVFGILGIVGFAGWVVAYLRPWNIRKLLHRAADFLLLHRRTAGTALTVLGFMLYSFLDFQNYPDWIPLLPFLALFAAWLLWGSAARVLQFLKVAPRVRYALYAALTVGVLMLSVGHAFQPMPPDRRMPGVTWQEQQQAAAELNQIIGANAPIWVIGKAELLFFMHRHNLNKYIYVFGNVDAAVDDLEPGGFVKMLDTAFAQKPTLLVVSRLQPRKFASLTNYQALQTALHTFVRLHHCRAIGGGTLYVRRDLADTLFPKNGAGCVRR